MKYLNFKLLIFFAALALAIPPAWAGTVYQKVTQASQLEVGKHYIFVYSNKALGGTIPTSTGGSTLSPVEVTVNADGSVDISNTTTTVFTLGEIVDSNSGSSYSSFIFDNNYYLTATTGTGITSSTSNSAAKWNPYSVNGGYGVISERSGGLNDGSSRGIIYRAGTTNKFGHYSRKNPTSSSDEYFWALLYVEKSDAVTVATPTFSLAEGTYAGEQNVTISCETQDATIYYSTDNGTTWEEYKGAISITQTTTLQAKAVKDGVESEVTTATYTITYDPNITVNPTSLSINDEDKDNTFTVQARNLVPYQNVSVSTPSGFSRVLSSETNSIESWGFNQNSNRAVDGTVKVTYDGTELIATGNIELGTQGATNSVAVNYRSDLYIVNNNGQGANGWNFNEGIPMTYADDVYTGTITTTNPDTKVVFARLLGNGVGWNSRLVFGAQSNDDWKYGTNTEGYLNVNDDVAIWFPEAGEYTITIDPTDKTFSITSTNVANLTEANAYTTGEQFKFNGRVVVTYRQGKNLWIRDIPTRDGSTTAGYIYNASNGTEFSQGDALKAGWTATKAVYNGLDEFTGAAGLEKDGTADFAPEVLTAINANTDVNKYVEFKGVSQIVDTEGNVVELRDQFSTNFSFAEGKVYDVTGIVSYYNKLQFYPISFTDVTPAALTVTLESDTKTAAVGETIPVTVTVENAAGDYTVTYKFGETGAENTLTGNVINVTSATPGQVELIVNVTNGDNHATATETYFFETPDAPLVSEFVLLTDITKLEDNKQIIIADKNTVTSTTVLGTNQKTNNRGVANCTVVEGLKITANEQTEIITLKKSGDKWYLKARKTAGYLYAPGGNNYLRTAEDITDAQTASISLTDDGDATIEFNTTATQRFLRYNSSGDGLFSCYNENNNQKDVYIYIEKSEEPLAVTLPDAPAEHYTVGDVVKVQATVENGSENTQLTYKVGDETLTIDNDGKVTLPNKKADDVVLTVTAVDGDKQATDTKTYVFDAADALTITLTPATGTYFVGDEQNVTVTVEGAIATNPTITYKFGEEEAQTYNADTGIVLPTAQAGTINLTVMVDDGGYEHTGATTATGTYTVNYKALTITLNPESGHQFAVGAENTKVKVEFANVVGDVVADYVASYTVNDEVKTMTLTADEQGYVTLPNDKAVTYTLKVSAMDERPDGDIVEATGTYTFTAAPAITFGLDVVHEPEGETYHVGDEIKVKVDNVQNNIGEYAVTYMLGETTLTPDENGYVTIPTAEVDNLTLTVTVTDGYDHATVAEQEFVFNIAAAPAITFDLVATPTQESYTVGDVVNVKVDNIQNVIGDNQQITYTTNFTREAQTYDPAKGIDITSNEAGTVTLEVTITDGYQHAADGVKSANYVFAKAGAISIAFDPESGTNFNVGQVAKVKVTVNGAAEGYQATYTIGDETGNVPADGIITLPSTAAGNVTLEVTVYDGLEHEGADADGFTTASATYKFNKLPAGLAYSASEASATVGSAFTNAPTLSNENGLTVTYTSSNPEVATVDANGTVTIVGEGTTTITATYSSETGNYENGSASYTLTVAPQPVVATPVITPNGGSYSKAQEVNITCATEGATILYSTDGTNWTEGNSLTVSENCTVYAKATKAGSIDSQVAQATFKFEIPETPVGPQLKGYYQIKNNANGEYVNVLGRKTLRFTTNPADQAGSVIYVETSDKNDGQVQSLRSQAADLQGYADRAMRYVPEVVQLVVNKLHATGAGEVLGSTGYDEIMEAFNASFDYHLYVEQDVNGYRLYGKTPSMQPVVDFYRSHKDQVDAKLPMIEGFVNEAIDKILNKTNGQGQSILVDYDIHEVWQRMGGTLTEPVDDATDLAFYQEVLNDKDNVWNFAYQSVMIYWERLKNNDKFQQMKPQLGEFANYIDKLEQIRPNTKYYVIQTDGMPDYVSDGNALILGNDACTYWTLEPRSEFTVNFPADNKYGDQYVTTLYTDFAYNVPEGVTAYKVTAVDEQGLAQIEALTSPIAAQTPVLLMAQANGRAEVAKTLTIAESGSAVDGNLLVGPDFLIERDSILTPQVAAVFALAKQYVSDDFYTNYVKGYEHLMFRNSGTVNNKYFWGISLDDLKNYCSYENDEGMTDCDVRSLGVEDGKIAFNEHFIVADNKAFLINKAFDVINLAVVETPVITPVPENPYTAPVEVTITCATEGATILYTTDGGENWTEYTEPFTLNETTTVQAYATKAGLGDSEKTEEVEYVIMLPVATPVVTPEGGSYGSAQTVTISCDTPDAVISYSTDGGETWTTYTEPFTVDTDCTITVKAEKTGMTPSETSVSYVFEIPESPIEVPALKGYFYIKNNESDNCFANVLGRKTLHFTSAPEDQAGTVYYLETDGHGQVQSLRSQAADFQGYADRAMNYVPKVVQIVANKLNATGSGNILGEHGYDEIMAAFNASFDHHLYVEPTNKGENVYRLYAKTPSMQPVVDFYRSHKDQVDAKLPMLEGFINQAIDKILEKTNNVGASILEDYDIHKVWTNMGGAELGLTEPVDDDTDLAFYQEVLNNKDYVWDFAYQSVMIYWNNLMQNETFQQSILPMLGNDAQYLENLTQIRPNTKYYVIKNGDELDYVSADHSYITGDAGKTYWTLDPRTTFDVNIPQELVYGNQYVTSLYTDFAYTLPDGVTAYKVSSISDKGVVDTEVLEGPIAAQTPVLLMTNQAGVKTLTIAESGNAATGNLLVGPDFLIERDSILMPQIAALFSFAKEILSEGFYENNVSQYEHLMFRTAGLVNNKYFWGISQDDLKKYCVYKNEDDEYDTDIRSLGVEKGSAAFCEHWTVETNKAFLIDETKEFETLVLRVRDITRDGKWDIADATALINILLEWPQILHADIWDYEAADFNHDGLTDIVDATDLIDYLLYK